MRTREWRTRQAETAAVGRNRTNDIGSVVARLLLGELRLLGTSRIASYVGVLAAWLCTEDVQISRCGAMRSIDASSENLPRQASITD